MSKYLSFDDVSLVPRFSTVNSRDDIDLTPHNKLGATIISANMDTVTGVKMCNNIPKPLGIGCLHRFQTLEELKEQLNQINTDCITSVGVDKEYLERTKLALEHGFNKVCVDVAHGHSSKCGEVVKELKNEFGEDIVIIAGNVCTRNGADYLVGMGADIVKVGVGPGSHCTTRVVTGHGVPQFSALDKICSFKEFEVIADGGIKNSGDIAKALAVGANYAMVGRLFAGTHEASGKKYFNKKVYKGSASLDAQRHKANPRVEGVRSLVTISGSIADKMLELENGLRSALSYSGCFNLKEFRMKATIVEITTNSHKEGTPHGL